LVEKQYLTALRIPDIDAILPDPQGPNALPAPAPDPKIVVETMKLQWAQAEFQMGMQLKTAELQSQLQETQANILELESKAVLNLATADGIGKGHEIAAIQSAVALMKQKQDGLIKALDVLKELSGMHDKKKELINGITGGMAGVENPPNDSGVV